MHHPKFKQKNQTFKINQIFDMGQGYFFTKVKIFKILKIKGSFKEIGSNRFSELYPPILISYYFNFNFERNKNLEHFNNKNLKIYF